MKTARNAVAVGLVTVVVAVGFYYAIQFVSKTRLMSNQYTVFAVFPDASGLFERSKVQIAGIRVGYIKSIKLMEYGFDAGVNEKGVPSEKKKVGARIDIILSGDVALYKDAAALRGAGGLLGEQYIILVPGTSTEPRLKNGDQIANTGDAGLLGNIDQISTDIRDVTKNLKLVFGSEKGGKQMGDVLANLRDISASINELLKKNAETVTRTLDNIDKIAGDARPGVTQILDDIKQITTELRSFVEKSSPTATSAVAETEQTVKEIRQTVAKLDKAIDNLGGIAEGLNKGEGTVGRLLKDDKLIDDVEGVVEGVSDIANDVFKLKTIVGLIGEFNFYDNTMKTSLQLRLQPREDKYYLIEAIYDPRGATSRTETVVETTNPEDPPQYREVRRVTKDSLLFSFMFARRIYFSTFRFGIKESSGGVGVDLHFLRDRVELSTDLYRFGEDVYPRLKEMVAMEFLRHVYIIGGINDVLNQGRDYFIGAMLRFNDEDLKTMLAFSPNVSP